MCLTNIAIAMTEKVLVLGAGAAGSVVANKVAREFRQEIAKDEVEITIMDKVHG